jgi:hypothetical protein
MIWILEVNKRQMIIFLFFIFIHFLVGNKKLSSLCRYFYSKVKGVNFVSRKMMNYPFLLSGLWGARDIRSLVSGIGGREAVCFVYLKIKLPRWNLTKKLEPQLARGLEIDAQTKPDQTKPNIRSSSRRNSCEETGNGKCARPNAFLGVLFSYF